MKTSELSGAALDWAVAMAEGYFDIDMASVRDGVVDVFYFESWSPSTDWAQGGAIIEREKISLIWMEFTDEQYWMASIDHPEREVKGNAPLVAAMRCYVASKLGDDVEIPEELQ